MNQSLHTHTYENGLVLVAEPMPALESAALSVLVPLGAAHDPPDRSGLSTLTAEMMIRGCGPRDSRRFIQDLENLGVERGETPGTSHTVFSGATLADNLLPALAIYADLLRRPHLADEQLEPARQVVLQDLRAIEDEPGQKTMIELRRRQYPLPWGRPPYGEFAAVEAASLDDVRRAFQSGYRPNGTILGVAGRIDWPLVRDEVGRLLADWEPRPEPAIGGGAALSKVEQLAHESNQTQIGIGYDSVPYRHPDYFTAWGAVGVLSGGMSSRLFTEVREKRGLCYSVYATYHTLRDWGSVLCYAGTSAERAQETLDVMLGELLRLAEGIEPQELARLKARIKSGLIMQQESSSARSSSIARDWYHLGRARTMAEVGALVDGLTCAAINDYLRQHPPRDFTIVTLGPSPLEVPLGVS